MAREPELFIAPCSRKYKDEAYRNFEDTALNGVLVDEYNISVGATSGRVPVWGVVSGNKGYWEQLQQGDLVLFYTMGGIYTHAARVHSTEQNEKLGDSIWTTYDGNRLVRDLEEPWPFLIYFYDVKRVDIPVEDIHPLIGWASDYPQRFTRVGDEGQKWVREKFGSIPAYIQAYASDKRVSESDAVEDMKTELLGQTASAPQLTADDVLTTEGTRTVRRQAFREAILELYDERCVVCGARRYSPSGNPAIEAAHIYPKSENGADDVRNGIALCKTHHWAFDVGWFGLRDDNTLLVRDADDIPNYEEFKKLSNRRIRLPESSEHQPHPIFKQAHRELHGLVE
jgi:putative restriction endonuclease